MDNTKLKFYDDVYAKNLESMIVEYGEDDKFGPFLVFNETIFHPHGGGQKGDKGKVTFISKPLLNLPSELTIIDTRRDKSGMIKHILEQQLERGAKSKLPGTKIKLQINWEFRYKQMRLHSSSHLIHAFMERVMNKNFPNPRISDILEDYGLNVYESVLDITLEDMSEVVSTMNEFLKDGHEITTYPDPQKPAFRFWQCEDIIIPCGGTHPKNTTEVGPVSAKMSVKRGKTKVLFRLS